MEHSSKFYMEVFDMRKQNVLRILALAMTIAMIILLSVCTALSMTSIAYSEVDYEEAGYNFLLAQYELNDIEYDNLVSENAINLYA